MPLIDGLGMVADRSKLRYRILPDGICLDADGGIWVASPGRDGEVVRVFEGGKIADRIKVETVPYACMLSGPDGKAHLVLTSDLFRDGQEKPISPGLSGVGPIQITVFTNYRPKTGAFLFLKTTFLAPKLTT